MMGTARTGRQEPAAVPPVSWDPLLRNGKHREVQASYAPSRHSIPELAGNFQKASKYFIYIWIAMLVWTFLPVFTSGMFLSGGIAVFAPLGVAALGVVVFSLMLARRKKPANSLLDMLRAPAIRGPVAEAAERIGLVPAGTITPDRLDVLRGPIGDVYKALEFPAEDSPSAGTEAPDEFYGRLPDGSPAWFLIKKSRIPLAGVPEQFRGGRKPDINIPAEALRMLAAFPLSRKTGYRLEILHRVMQVMFLRVASTIDTGSAEFNNRFLVAAGGDADDLFVHRMVTPALQTVLIALFDRYWLANVVIDDDTAYVSAVDFRHMDGGADTSTRWIETTLGDFTKSVGRIKTYID